MAHGGPVDGDVTSPSRPATSTSGTAKTALSSADTTIASASEGPSSKTNTPPRPPPAPSSWFHSARRPKTAPGQRSSPFRARSLFSRDDARRDSGLAPSNATAVKEGKERGADGGAGRSTPSLPAIVVHDEHHGAQHVDASREPGEGPATADARCNTPPGSFVLEPFQAITTSIPTGSFEDLTMPGMLSFSNRGSVLLGGKRANGVRDRATSRVDMMRRPSEERIGQASPSPRGGIMSADDAIMSKKVRSMYAAGNESGDRFGLGPEGSSRSASELGNRTPDKQSTQDLHVERARQGGSRVPSGTSMAVSNAESTGGRESVKIAGGIEDWDDIDGRDVDRYGFIIPRRDNANGSASEHSGMQRASTLLQVASESPRRRRSIRRAMSGSRSTRSAGPAPNTLKRKTSFRSAPPANSIYSSKSSASSVSQGPLRFVSNRLPHHKQRKLLDEAGDMLTLPPGLADIAEEKEGGQGAARMKRKEWGREEKWRRMGRATSKAGCGGGMVFDFNTKDPKLISRTWKGIPDKWRATAWHAFLSASAVRRPDSLTDEELVERFQELQDEDCAEDLQIDVDVPRTISQHVMFRRRYRGGQRLLFRVLHALTLEFPEIGYVQGMASLAATLLCYYDEESAFIMMVRLWDHRGLRQLYARGFEGLMTALVDFEKNWLGEGAVGKKLAELGIQSTTYGAKWYLTLFHHVLPFPAQLRIWDVYMLLGDASIAPRTTESEFSGELDVLHAASAALFDAMRDILLDADFETSMNMLTHSIPIKDEDLLMRVAKAEFKQRRRKAKPA